MPKTDANAAELLTAFDQGALKSLASRAKLTSFKAAARATAWRHKRVNIRQPSGDLQGVQI